MRILITGGCGFFGHHLIEHIVKNTDWDIVLFDKLTYASSGFDRLRDTGCFDFSRVRVLTVDFSQPISVGIVKELGQIDYVLHAGAETHVDNSISDPEPFVTSNVIGTWRMLELLRYMPTVKKFIYFSTDEVFGPAPENVNYKEGDRYNPGNPYSATKAAGECLASAYANTYRLPIIITNTMNLYGERQDREKFIPLCIKKIFEGDKVIIHSNKDLTKSGTRFYIHCRNVAAAILFILNDVNEFLSAHDASKGKFNIVGEKEMSNLEVAQFVAKILGKELKYEMVDFHSSRPGHDLRYSLDGNKLKNTGFKFPLTFEESFEKNINWHLLEENKKWLDLKDYSMSTRETLSINSGITFESTNSIFPNT